MEPTHPFLIQRRGVHYPHFYLTHHQQQQHLPITTTTSYIRILRDYPYRHHLSLDQQLPLPTILFLITIESLIISQGTQEKKEKLNYKSSNKSNNWEELSIQRAKNFLQQATTRPAEFMTMNFIGLSKWPSSSLPYRGSNTQFRGLR